MVSQLNAVGDKLDGLSNGLKDLGGKLDTLAVKFDTLAEHMSGVLAEMKEENKRRDRQFEVESTLRQEQHVLVMATFATLLKNQQDMKEHRQVAS